MELYHVAVDSSTAEREVIKDIQPPRLLLSYFYFRNKSLKEYTDMLGYRPKIILDSGAYSAWNKGKGIALTDYMDYISENKDYIYKYFTLDVVGDPELSYWYYKIMKEKGFNPIPVYHYGEDESWLERYTSETDYIGLGGTVPEKDKGKVSDWIRFIVWQYPDMKFHVLGSSSPKIINTCDVYSTDSSTYWMQSINGKPQHIKGRTRQAKIDRAKYNMIKELEKYDKSFTIPNSNSYSECSNRSITTI